MTDFPTPDPQADVWGQQLLDAIRERIDWVQEVSSWGPDLGYDEEFTETSSGVLPTDWTWVNQGTSTYEQKFSAGVIHPEPGSGDDDGHRMIVRPCPTSGEWTAVMRLGGMPPSVKWARVGIVMRESATGKYTYFGLAGAGWNDHGFRLQLNNWSSLNTFSGSEVMTEFSHLPTYFRVSRKGDGTFSFWYSNDGICWTRMEDNRAAYASYDQVGLLVNVPNGQAFDGAVHWLRVR